MIEIDPVRAGTFYVTAGPERMFRTTDGGHTWTPFATGLNGAFHDLGVDRAHPATIYAGAPFGTLRSSPYPPSIGVDLPDSRLRSRHLLARIEP